MRLMSLIIAGLISITASATIARPTDEPSVTPISGTLSLIDTATGQSKDLLKIEKQSLGQPAVVGETVYVTCSDRTAYSLDAKTGKVNWHLVFASPLFAVTATDKVVFFGSGGMLDALDPATGKLLWKYQSDLAIVDPVLVDGTIVFNAFDGPVALEQSTGQLRWRLPVQWGYFVFSPLGNHRLCVWKPDETFVFETEHGKQLWQNTPDQSSKAPGALPSAAVANEDTIYQLRGSPQDADDWSLHARDSDGGRELWKRSIGHHEFTRARTAIAGDSVYAIVENSITSIDAEKGTQKWTAKVDQIEAGGAPPVADHGLVFIPELGGDITVLDEKTGKPVWQNAGPKPSQESQIRIGGMRVSNQGVLVTRNEQIKK